MKEFLDRLLQEIPRFMGDLVQCLVNPRAFFQEQLTGRSGREIVEKGISFFILASVVVFVLTKLLPAANQQSFTGDAGALIQLVDDRNNALQFGTGIISGAFELLAVAAIVLLAWRLVRAQASFQQCFGLAAAVLSILLIANVFIQAIPNLARVDPAVGRNMAALEKKAVELQPVLERVICSIDPETGALPSAGSSPEAAELTAALSDMQAKQTVIAARPLSRLTQGLQLLVRLALLIWLLTAWSAFGRSLAAPAHAWLISVVPAAGGLFLLAVVMGLIEASDYSRRLYARC